TIEQMCEQAVSELRSAIGGYASVELSEIPDAVAEEDFAELMAARESLDAELLRRTPDIERRGIHQREGHLSMASWLVGTFRTRWAAAKDQVRTGRGLQHMPVTRRALDAGAVSPSA